MWSLEHELPLSVEGGWLRSVDGQELWVVSVKATLDVGEGLTLADEQEPVTRAPIFEGEPGRSSLLVEAELTLPRPLVDVVVVGEGRLDKAADRTTVHLRAGRIDKRLQLWGPRRWGSSFTPGAAEPAERFPVSYEHAFGGRKLDAESYVHPFNPVGPGFAEQATAALVGQVAPRVERLGAPVGLGREQRPAGFGAIASHWQPRLALAGTFDDTWFEERRPLLPSDYDLRFNNAAPADQQLEREALEDLVIHVEGMGCPYVAVLPPIDVHLESELPQRRLVHQAPLVCIHAEPNERRLILLWQSVLDPGDDSYELACTTVTASGLPER
ncbi:MAG: DUF2169 domain-containing protein [Myxococcota bacterium]